jgi:hypothetical protein
MVELHGAHLVSHERPDEVNNALMDLIKATKSAMKPEEWSAQPENVSETGALISGRPITVTMLTDEGVIVMGFEHMRNIVKVMKPVRVAAIES